jgi:predicted deacylase
MAMRIKYTLIKILTGSDLSHRRLPLIAAQSRNQGPVLWLTACGHGDEVAGIVVIQEIFKIISRYSLIRGALYAFPLMNPLGFEATSRNIILSEEDLNRSFPGNKQGSLAQRIADTIFSFIMQTGPALVLDLHNDWIQSIPYALIDPHPGHEYKEVYEKTKLYCRKTGLIAIRERDVIKNTLSHSLLQHHIPAVTLELGESYIVNEKNIELGVKVILNVLSSLEMISPLKESFVFPLMKNVPKRILTYSDKPLSSSSGIIRFLIKPGDVVIKDQPVAKIYNALGKLQETLCAREESIVLGYSDYSVAFPGKPVVAYGLFRSK